MVAHAPGRAGAGMSGVAGGTAGCAFVLAMAVHLAAAAAPLSATSAVAVHPDLQRVAQLQALEQLTLKSGAEAVALGQQARALRSQLAAARQAGDDAQASAVSSDACLAPLQAAAEALGAGVSAAEAAQAESRAAVAALNRAPADQLGALASRADRAFVARGAREAALQRTATAWRPALRACQSQAAASDAVARHAAAALQRVRQQAAVLPERSRAVRTLWFEAKAGATAAAQRGWLPAAAVAGVTATLDSTAIDALARALPPSAAGPWSASATAPDATALSGSADVWAAADERAKLTDAAAMAEALSADCGTAVADADADAKAGAAAGCVRLTAQRADLAARAAALSGTVSNRLDAAVQAVSAQQAQAARQRESNAANRAEWVTLAAQVEPAADAALRIAAEAQAAAQQLRAQVEPAEQLARRDAGGVGGGHVPASSGSELPGTASPAPAPVPVFAGSGPTAAPSLPRLTGHAWEFFRVLNGERKGFGAYTYVLVRSVHDLAQPAVLRRYAKLIEVVQRERRGDAVAATDAPFVNLFCLPGQEGGTPQSLAQGYDDELSLQLLFRAQSGLLTRPEMRRRLRDSTGPFLLTLPVRIGDAVSATPLLFADLSAYPDDAIADLVDQYKGSLLATFPSQQAAWKPPVPQRVALVMIGLASDVGSLVMSVMPAALAGER